VQGGGVEEHLSEAESYRRRDAMERVHERRVWRASTSTLNIVLSTASGARPRAPRLARVHERRVWRASTSILSIVLVVSARSAPSSSGECKEGSASPSSLDP
jgi:hypothetical protein